MSVDIGIWITRISIIAYVYEMTKSGFITSLVLLLQVFPKVFLSIPFNKIARKVGFEKSCMLSLFSQILITLGIYFSIHYIYIVLILIFLKSITETLYSVSSLELIPTLIQSKNKLIKYNFKLSVVTSLIMIFGQIIGGILYSFLGINSSIFINIVTYCIACSFMILIYTSPKPLNIQSEKNNIEKYNNFTVNPNFKTFIKLIILINSIIVVSGGVFNTFIPIFIQKNFNANAQLLGIIMSNFGIGAFLTTLIFSAKIKSISSYIIFCISLIGCAIVITLFGFTHSQIIICVLVFFYGSFSAMRGTSCKTIVQCYSITKRDSLIGLFNSTQNIGLLMGMIIGSYIIKIDKLNIGAILFGFTNLLLILCCLMILNKSNKFKNMSNHPLVQGDKL